MIRETTIEADSKFEVYEIMESENNTLLSLKEKAEPINLQVFPKFRKVVKPQELENLTSQLVVMLKAGVPLIECLESIEEQAETDKLQKILQDIIQKVRSGQPFSSALADHPNVFNTLYVNMVKIGEATGVLEGILDNLRVFIRHDIQVSKNIKAALRYPIIVLTILALAFTGAIVFIIPKFSKMFLSAGVTLPLPTRILIGISHMFINYWWITLLAIIGIITALRFYLKTNAGAVSFDKLKLSIPIFKDIILKSSVARFAHILQTLMKSGIQIVKALEITELTLENRILKKDISSAKGQVVEGVSLSESLSDSRYFPKMTIKMISIGERSGSLEQMLENIAHQYDTEVDAKIDGLSAVIEPLMTVLIGIFLLIFAMGIFLPMWDMNTLMK